ncbi:MAG TPA: FHA domain-containing protein [Thermoanaerobaculia bacterium]|nr:FHA domain-containing protein [Thermoanaerobaculia bacterium]
MTDERATGRDVILAIGENMRQSLEPLVTKTLAPSLYQVYLHADDHDHLRTLFPQLEAEAKRLLDGELLKLNRGALPKIARLASLLGRKAPEAPPGTMRYESAEARWSIRFQEDPNGTLQPGEIEVISEFAQTPTGGYGAGAKTYRISTTRRLGQMATQREAVDPRQAYAKITFADDRGPQTYLMTKDEIVIGREAADVWVDLRLETSLDVSREHARLKRTADGKFRIKDLSKLGTTVDGRPVPGSLESADGEVRDLDRWADLPDRARIGLAGVMTLDFERSAGP